MAKAAFFLEGDDMESSLVRVLPSVFAESTYLLDGKPFRLTNRHYLKSIYDSDTSEYMIMSGRQVEKSTTESTHIANYTLLIPYFKALYVAPTNEQVKVFSRDRIGKLYEFSQNDVVKNNFMNPHLSNAVFFKEFANGSSNYFRHCFETGDNIRGLTANGIFIDELQDIHIDAIPVIKETQAHAMEAGANMRITGLTGTPKTFSNTIQQYWDRSSQNEWVVKCSHCNTYQIMDINNLEPTKFVCQKCKQELNKNVIINGFWHALQPDKKMIGFRISQLMVPWITADEIWDKYTNYAPDKFHNEVLGRSYENAAKPFTPLMLGAISANAKRMLPRAEGEFSNAKIYMGVDWGTGDGSYTVVYIGGYNYDGKFQMIFTKRYAVGQELDPEYQLRDIANMMTLYKITYAIVDWGFGYQQYKKLQKMFGRRVAACYYSFNQKQQTKWDPAKGTWTVNRTAVIANYVSAIQNMQIEWPGNSKSEFTWLFDHHLAEMSEYRKAQSGRSEELMFTHPEGMPDDGMHAGVYCYLASQLSSNFISGNIEFASAYGTNI